MEVFILVIVISGALLAIASGVWVAFALGNAISSNKENTSSFAENDNVAPR